MNNACAGRFIAQVIVFDEREEKNMVAQVSRVTKINYLCRHNTNRNSYKQQNLKIMAYVIGDDCVACGTCIDECPVGAISEGEKYSINPEMCTECGTCADVCPSGAISLQA